MPWKASSVMEEKVRFVLEYERDERTMTELCEVYGIARETGYVWLRRYRERGLAGLVELNPRPFNFSVQSGRSRSSLAIAAQLYFEGPKPTSRKGGEKWGTRAAKGESRAVQTRHSVRSSASSTSPA